MANHSRWCDSNPKQLEYKSNLSKTRAGITNKSIERRNKNISKAWSNGKYNHVDHRTFLGKTHSEESKQLIREKALASQHRRLRRNIIEYKGVLLDSTWELELAKRLDELEIKWIRPDPIPWKDDQGVVRNYFPDFYLTEHDLYIDPKNPHAIKVQRKKIKCLLSQYKNIVIIGSLKECKEFQL